MIKVENKATTLFLTEKVQATYADLLEIVLNKPVPQGITISEMRRDLRIIEVVEKGKDQKELSFDSEDFKAVADKVENSTWAVISPEILAFADYINSLK